MCVHSKVTGKYSDGRFQLCLHAAVMTLTFPMRPPSVACLRDEADKGMIVYRSNEMTPGCWELTAVKLHVQEDNVNGSATKREGREGRE